MAGRPTLLLSSSSARVSCSNCTSCSLTDSSRAAALSHCSIHTTQPREERGPLHTPFRVSKTCTHLPGENQPITVFPITLYTREDYYSRVTYRFCQLSQVQTVENQSRTIGLHNRICPLVLIIILQHAQSPCRLVKA